jgi:hypothetical protein
MKVNRASFLATLQEVSIGISNKENLEQSNCFIFTGEHLIAFNDQILVRAESPVDFEGVLLAADLMKAIEKLPDDEVDIVRQENEVVITGNRRSAGITCAAEVRLPYDTVPKPEKWSKLVDGTAAMLQQAARTCGNDDTQFLTTVVHVTPERIEACDNYRLFRADGPTGFNGEILIPAGCLGALTKMAMIRVCIGKGWVHFRLGSGTVVSCRASHEPYHSGVDDLLKIKNGEDVSLPGNLDDIIGRASIMNESGYDARIGVAIQKGEITITARKDGGWYKERKKVTYTGQPIIFDINPAFLSEIMKRTTDVIIGSGRLKIEIDNIKVVVSLVAKGQDNEPETAPKGKRAKDESEGEE